jgi:hypothetical protein
MMKTGVILNPLIDTQAEWEGWYTGMKLSRVVSLRLLTPPVPEMIAPHVRLRLVQADRLIPRDSRQLRDALAYPMFETTPVSVEGPSPRVQVMVDGNETLLVRTPSVMTFDVAPGKHVLTGKYGLLERSYTEGSTDGATFSVTLRPKEGKGSRVLFKVFLEPQRVEADRGLIDMRVPFESDTPAQLLLRTGPGPRNDPTHDLTLWSAIRIGD